MVVSIPETKEFCVADQLHDQIAGSMDSYISTKDSEEVLPLVWRWCWQHCVNMQANIAGKDNIELQGLCSEKRSVVLGIVDAGDCLKTS